MRSEHNVVTPYGGIATVFDRLDDWIVENWGERPVADRVAFMTAWWKHVGAEIRDVLDIGCGTGLLLAELVRTGYAPAGLDRSTDMLAFARERVGEDVRLYQASLPEIPLPADSVDAVTSTGGVLNYVPGSQALTEVFRSVLRVLRPGGTFVFDILSPTMLGEHLGRGVWAADLDDFAFVWTFADHHDAYSDASYVQFLRRPDDPVGVYTCSREQHRLYKLDSQVVRSSAERAGFASAQAWDNYTDALPDEATLYETWVLTAPGTRGHR